MTTILDRSQLEVILPHRGVNLFVDQVTVSADQQSSSSRIRLSDVPGSCLLMTRSGAAGRLWYEPFLAELLALTGAPLVSAQLPVGQVAAFGMMSRVRFGVAPPIDGEVMAEVTVLRRRDQTTFFRARAEHLGVCILEAEVASSVVDLRLFSPATEQTPVVDAGIPICMSAFAWKDSSLRLLDVILSEDATSRRLVAGFTFSSCHPFVSGHFPTAPLMMGVLQWAAMVDAVWLAHQRFGDARATSIVANGAVRRADGSLVAEIKELRIDIIDGAPFIRETKRIIFREPVHLRDRIVVEVTLVAQDSAQPAVASASS